MKPSLLTRVQLNFGEIVILIILVVVLLVLAFSGWSISVDHVQSVSVPVNRVTGTTGAATTASGDLE